MMEVNNCCGVVVTFFPDDKFETNFSLIVQQIPNVVIVDNSAAVDVQHRLEKLVAQYNTKLVKNSKNLGIGEGLNQGIDYAKEVGAKWLFCFDQDSAVKANYFDVMNRASSLLLSERFILGCNYLNTKNNRPRHTRRYSKGLNGLIVKKTVITSGMLIPLSLVDAIGYFRADYFIDSVDHEYCLRARKNGCKVLLTSEVGLYHEIGLNQTESKPLVSVVPQHSPLRKYYMTRNTLVTSKNYWHEEKLWGIKQVVRIVIELISVLLFEDSKREKLRAMVSGIRDAMRGRLGVRKT